MHDKIILFDAALLVQKTTMRKNRCCEKLGILATIQYQSVEIQETKIYKYMILYKNCKVDTS